MQAIEIRILILLELDLGAHIFYGFPPVEKNPNFRLGIWKTIRPISYQHDQSGSVSYFHE